jgi:hypothetical protein
MMVILVIVGATSVAASLSLAHDWRPLAAAVTWADRSVTGLGLLAPAQDLVPWGIALVIAVAAGCLIYFQHVAVRHARAAQQRAEAELAARSARLAALIETLQATPAEGDRLAGEMASPTRSGAAVGPATAFAEEESRLAGLFADQAARLGECARLVEQAQYELAERHRAEDQLRYRAAFERLAVNLAGRFVALSPAEVDDGVNQGLAAIGSFAGADRGYVFLLAPAGATLDNTHEWCAEEVEPQMANSQDVPGDSLPWWMARLRGSETIHIPLVSALPPEAGAEREFLERRGVRSLVVTPMTLDQELVGFLGFDSVRGAKTWSAEDVALLGILGAIIVDALERADIVWTTW